jgi:hypothetical protein
MIDLSEKIQDLEAKFTIDGLQIEYGGEIFAAFELPESEAYGLLAAIIILVIAFGSVLAMGLPIGTAILGLGVGVSTVSIVSQLVSMPDFTTSLVAMIGLGVGIDYALFIVTRYRECLADGLSVEDSVVEAVDTSGRAVIFAGIFAFVADLTIRRWDFPFGFSPYRPNTREDGRRDDGAGLAVIIAFTIIALSWGVSILIRFAISRSREYLADAGSVELTKNPDAMISALRKIEAHAAIPTMPSRMHAFFIESPAIHQESGWLASHPSVDDRVAALIKFAGGHEVEISAQGSCVWSK